MFGGHGGHSITTASVDSLDSKNDFISDVWVALRDLYQWIRRQNYKIWFFTSTLDHLIKCCIHVCPHTWKHLCTHVHTYTHPNKNGKKYERMEVLGPNEKSPGLGDVPLKEKLGSWSSLFLILTSRWDGQLSLLHVLPVMTWLTSHGLWSSRMDWNIWNYKLIYLRIYLFFNDNEKLRQSPQMNNVFKSSFCLAMRADSTNEESNGYSLALDAHRQLVRAFREYALTV